MKRSARVVLVLALLLPLAMHAHAQEDMEKSTIPVDDAGRLRLTPDDGLAFVGLLIRNVELGIANPSEYALEDGFLWRGSEHRLGRVNVFGLDPEVAAGLHGKVVVIHGTLGDSLDDRLEKIREAPADYGDEESQMARRDDWTSPECGFTIGRSTHARLKDLPCIEASGPRAIRAVEIVTILDAGEAADPGGDGGDGDGSHAVRLRISNPFDRPLAGLTPRLRYERLNAQPLAPEWVEMERLALEPGASIEVEVPRVRVLTTARGSEMEHGLEEVELVGAVGGTHLDLRMPVHAE